MGGTLEEEERKAAPRAHVVLLSGGSGSRLWPLSNGARSKQFLKVLRDPEGSPESMVQRTFRMLAASPLACDVTVATNAQQAQPLAAQLPEMPYALVEEPERRDTAPAILLAAAHLASEQGASPDDPVVVLPIDAWAEASYYARLADLASAAREGEADLVLLGVEPSFASEKYGYVVPAARVGEPWRVHRFVEKPSAEAAEGLVALGALWNCGVFAFRLSWALSLLEGYLGTSDYGEALSRYAELPKSSFDYEVVERAESVAVLPYAGDWKDLGTWNTLAEEMADAASGPVVGVEGCENTHVVNETGLPMVVSGLEDAVIVATPDGILACSKAASSHMKPLVERAQASRPMYERRRWGEYRVLWDGASEGAGALSKELVLEPGRQLSYQRHAGRSEVWTVVSGEGEVVLDGRPFPVGPGSVVEVPAGCWHAARAGEGGMSLVEVQIGSPLVEEDIERDGDFWKQDDLGEDRY